jgi:hypothetical protein
VNGRPALGTASSVGAGADWSDSGFGTAEHRYRIIGRMRFALFSIERDNVGSARMTWRSDGATTALTLLVGSDPQRAPRSLNQWGYLREEVRSDHAEVFSLRSLDGAEAAAAVGFSIGDGPRFGVSCSSLNERDIDSTRTTVYAPGVTYRMFEQLLDRIAVSSQWEEGHTPRPRSADAGFLTALEHAIRMGPRAGTDPKSLKMLQSVAYVYNGVLYDLTIRGNEFLGRTTVGRRTFDRLMRSDFSIRNRQTGDVSKFGVTFSPNEAGTSLPVQIFYQPNFWLRVELRLDDDADVPADPAADGTSLRRMRAICAGAAE